MLLAEIVKHYFPSLVDLHNYTQAHSVQQKTYNWGTLNEKVLKRLGVHLDKALIEQLAGSAPDAIEYVLKITQDAVSSIIILQA